MIYTENMDNERKNPMDNISRIKLDIDLSY
jgi:hypothetical protein